MSLQYKTVRKGVAVFTSDGAAEPHFQYSAGKPRLVLGRADADPKAAIFLNGKLVPIGALYTPGTPTLRQRDASKINWSGPLVVSNNISANQPDGSYLVPVGNYRSTDPNGSPAILIQTSLPVKIDGCNVMGYGGFSNAMNLINNVSNNSRTEVRNTIGFSGNPGVAGTIAGRFISVQYFKSLVVEHCEAYGTTGIAAIGYQGNHTSAEAISIKHNKLKNLDGRVSSGVGTYRTGNTRGGSTSDFVIANFFQSDQCSGIIIEIAYNECINEAHASRYEDMVSFSRTRGNANGVSNGIWVHHNLWRGGYVYDPYYIPGTSTTYGNNMPTGGATGLDNRGFVNSGGGGLLSDGIGTSAADDPAYGVMEDNVVLDMSNYGVGISAGHDQSLLRNLILNSGYVHNLPGNVIVTWAGTPVQVQDYQTSRDPARWFAHVVNGNISGRTFFEARTNGYPQQRNLITIDPPTASYTASGNVDLGFQTRAMVDQAEANWGSARAGEGRTIGAV